jgi:hypothetical protein
LRDDGYRGKEIAECLRKGAVVVKGYLRKEEDLRDKIKRLILLLKSVRNIFND